MPRIEAVLLRLERRLRGFPKNRSYFSTSKNRSSLFAVENVRPKKSLAASPKIGAIFLHRKRSSLFAVENAFLGRTYTG